MKKHIQSLFYAIIVLIASQQSGYAQNQASSILKKDFFKQKQLSPVNEVQKLAPGETVNLDHTHFLDGKTGQTLLVVPSLNHQDKIKPPRQAPSGNSPQPAGQTPAKL